ncbi:MAG TPA: TonB-dependent receptor, partial [Gemmatimonadaceae bacterium]
MRLFLSWMLATSVLAASALAQGQPSGAIRGHVADDAGRPVAASVSITSPDGASIRSTVASATGAFLLSGVAPGTYDVTVQRIGFRRTLVRGVIVQPGQIAEIEVTLTAFATELAPLVVQASTVLIKPGDSQFESRVGETAIAKLPVGYDVDRVLAFTPGSRPGGLWGGASPQANTYELDGVAVNDPGVGGRLFEPNVNWIEQMEVRGLGAPAEYGDFQGGLVDMVTKSGGNTRRGFMRANTESRLFNSSGFVGTELVPELSDRRAVEGEARGPIVRDRLFYYGSAQVIRSSWQAIDHLSALHGISPVHERTTQDKVLGKLTWTPVTGDLVNLSLGTIATNTSNFGLTGREAPDATSSYSAPTLFGNASWERQFGRIGAFEARANVVHVDERVRPGSPSTVPAISTYQLATAHDYQNAPFSERRTPTSTGATAIWRKALSSFGFDHRLAAGAEWSVGSYSEDRTRTGGMTWRPRYTSSIASTFDPKSPATWPAHIPTSWGGEVHLSTDVRNGAQFVQDEMTAGRLTLTPGLRFGQWQGRIAAPDGAKFVAVNSSGLDPRMGLVLDLSADAASGAGARQPTFVAKLHAGRYHQNLFGQMFDRAAGSSAYTDQELWQYEGPPPPSSTQTFSVRERDSLATLGQFTLLEHADLSPVGSTRGLREPYVDQVVAGLQKLALQRHVKIEALYVLRVNHDQIALEDRNVGSNWTAFQNVEMWPNGVLNGAGTPINDQRGRTLVLPTVYVPNNAIIATLKTHAKWAKIDPVLAVPFAVPGFTDADTARLAWNPDYALTNVSAARRRFHQLQLNGEAVFEGWTAAASFAWSDLEGNLPSVTGYDDATVYGRDAVSGRGPGPFVRPNELIDAFGKLGGYSKLDLKVRASVDLPWRTRAGVFA